MSSKALTQKKIKQCMCNVTVKVGIIEYELARTEGAIHARTWPMHMQLRSKLFYCLRKSADQRTCLAQSMHFQVQTALTLHSLKTLSHCPLLKPLNLTSPALTSWHAQAFCRLPQKSLDTHETHKPQTFPISRLPPHTVLNLPYWPARPLWPHTARD